MTHYGLNPSFCNWSARLPLFANALQRGKQFEEFDSRGRPTGRPSKLGPDGLPVFDGNSHGLRVFSSDSQAVPLVEPSDDDTLSLQRSGGGLVTVSASVWERGDSVPVADLAIGRRGTWHEPSLRALASLHPKVLRTLDWQRTNEKTDWLSPRVRPEDLLQGTDRGMAVELQADAANLLGCHLWWCAPPRYALPMNVYEERLEEMLTAIALTAKRPPILEYGNELWNAGFPVHGWLKQAVTEPLPWPFPNPTWHWLAAQEITTLKRVADRVFGPPGPLGQKPYYLFVGGQLTVPSHLDKILGHLGDLGVTPDLAGPALYVTPPKAQKEEWEATGAVPTQEELRDSCFMRLLEIEGGPVVNGPGVGPLQAHNEIRQRYGVPHFACYEAGQSLIAGHHPWRAAAIAAQRTDWMSELYTRIRATAEAAGVDLCLWYSACTTQEPADTRVDVFGLLEGDSQRAAMLPKAIAARGD